MASLSRSKIVITRTDPVISGNSSLRIERIPKRSAALRDSSVLTVFLLEKQRGQLLQAAAPGQELMITRTDPVIFTKGTVFYLCMLESEQV